MTPTDDKPSIQLLDWFDLPHGRKVICITERVSAKWEKLGYALKAEKYVIDIIKRDHKSDGVTTCCQELLAKWLDGNFGDGRPTWEKFLTSLKHVDCQLARCIRNRLTSQGMVCVCVCVCVVCACMCVCVRVHVCVCTRHVVIVTYNYIGEVGDDDDEGDDDVAGPSEAKVSKVSPLSDSEGIVHNNFAQKPHFL